MSRFFSHSGDLGDIIYALPVMKAKWELTGEKARLELFDTPGKTAHGMTEAKTLRIRSLLVLQDYIDDVVWNPSAADCSLNGFRHHGRHGNLVDMHLATHGLDWRHRIAPWISVPSTRNDFAVVLSRSPRYHNTRFPWGAIVEKYSSVAGYVGFPEEHEAFCKAFGSVPLIDAGDFLELARVIAGSKLFIGNQSSPAAVAHGLKHTMVQEVCPHHGSQHHCIFQRLNCILGWDEKLELPEVV